MIQSFKDLLKYIKTLPSEKIVQEVGFDDIQYNLIKDQDCYYLLNCSSDGKKNLFVGIFIDKNLQEKYSNRRIYPEVIQFKDGSGFLPHSINGPAFYSGFSEALMSSYIIYGRTLNNEQEFNLHPEVIVNKNKLSLKKKFSTL